MVAFLFRVETDCWVCGIGRPRRPSEKETRARFVPKTGFGDETELFREGISSPWDAKGQSRALFGCLFVWGAR